MRSGAVVLAAGMTLVVLGLAGRFAGTRFAGLFGLDADGARGADVDFLTVPDFTFRAVRLPTLELSESVLDWTRLTRAEGTFDISETLIARDSLVIRAPINAPVSAPRRP
jgi:hypothetical protein